MLEQFDKKYIEKMGFSDSYLIKVLTKARDEAKQYIPCNCKNYDNHKLIFLNFGDPNLITNTYKPKSESKDIEIKFNTFYKKKSPGMELYFL